MVTTFHWEFSYLTEVFCGTSKDTRRPPAELLALAFPQAMSGTTWRGNKKHHKKDRLLGLIMGQDHILESKTPQAASTPFFGWCWGSWLEKPSEILQTLTTVKALPSELVKHKSFAESSLQIPRMTTLLIGCYREGREIGPLLSFSLQAITGRCFLLSLGDNEGLNA